MAINFASEFPLLIAGTEVLVNPSFEDWISAVPRGWTVASGSVSANSTYIFPSGERSCALTGTSQITQALLLSSFGYSTMPSWAIAFVLAVCYNGAGGTIAIGATSAALANSGGLWKLGYVEATSTGTISITAPGTTLYVDSVMAGLVVDCNVFFKEWNPILKPKGTERKSPYGVTTNIISNALDLKANLQRFDNTLKEYLVGFVNYTRFGHYFSCILDRASSGQYPHEVMPYLYNASQEVPGYLAGAPNVYDLPLNGEGCLP